jgi:hypothetical protein
LPTDVIAHDDDDVRLLRLRMQTGPYGQHREGGAQKHSKQFHWMVPYRSVDLQH